MKAFLLALLVAGIFVSAPSTQLFAQAENFREALESLPKVKGVVRKVDKSNSKITLKHEDIPNLEMPGMTMPFKVASQEMLDEVSAGDKVLFQADEVNGELTVMWIEKQL